jgi:hypothetical protein
MASLDDPRPFTPTLAYLCVDPKGVPYLPSLNEDRASSLAACFGPNQTQKRLDDLAEAGWRCVPVNIAPPETLETEVFVLAVARTDGALPAIEKIIDNGFYTTPGAAQEKLSEMRRQPFGTSLRTFRGLMRLTDEVEIGTTATSKL